MKTETSRNHFFKLDKGQKETLKFFLQRHSNADIASFFAIDHTTVIYYRRKYNIVHPRYPRPIPGIEKKHRGRPKMKKKTPFDYESYIEVNDTRRIEAQGRCDHQLWIKKCSCCGGILENERGINTNLHFNESKN